jgi:hypothetical protein
MLSIRPFFRLQILIFSAIVLSAIHIGAQAPTTPAASSPAHQQPIEIPPAPGAVTARPDCPPLADGYIPVQKTVEVTLSGPLEASRLKPGKEIWMRSKYAAEISSECFLDANAAVYAHITAASSSKNSAGSQLALAFDHADCRGYDKKQLDLTLIAVIAPSEVASDTVRDSLPATALNDGYGFTQKLNPGGPPHFVRPGIVLNMRKLALDPQGGPQCSARLSSADRNIQLPAGTILLLSLPGARP